MHVRERGIGTVRNAMYVSFWLDHKHLSGLLCVGSHVIEGATLILSYRVLSDGRWSEPREETL